jgi:hypothetical protein
MKQIYYKHKNIKWEWVDVSECMIQDDFLWLQHITYLD